MDKVIKSKENALIKQIKKISGSKSARQKNKEFVIEGLRLCLDAAKSNIEIKTLLFSKDLEAKKKKEIDFLKSYSKKFACASDSVLKSVSNTENLQGIVCLCGIKERIFSEKELSRGKNIIFLEDISDPTNLGTILRTAEALLIDFVVLSEGCCDIYNDKVLRGSMGAVFRLKVLRSKNFYNLISFLKEQDFNVFASVLSKDSKLLNKVDFKGKNAIILGNEGNGLKKETISLCSERLFIPMRGKAESLNVSVAASIIMWEMTKEA